MKAIEHVAQVPISETFASVAAQADVNNVMRIRPVLLT